MTPWAKPGFQAKPSTAFLRATAQSGSRAQTLASNPRPANDDRVRSNVDQAITYLRALFRVHTAPVAGCLHRLETATARAETVWARYTPAPGRNSVRVVSEETAQRMRLMMESVVSPDGTAPTAAIPGYRVAGKTGTAQRVDDNCHCYRGYTASFIGFAPADKPKYVVSVTIQDPRGLHWGGLLAGPVFKKVMSFVLQSQHVAPTTAAQSFYPLTEAELKARTNSNAASQVSSKSKQG